MRYYTFESSPLRYEFVSYLIINENDRSRCNDTFDPFENRQLGYRKYTSARNTDCIVALTNSPRNCR